MPDRAGLGGRTRGRVRMQGDRCCLEHTLSAAPGACGPTGTWRAHAPGMGLRLKGRARAGSAAPSMSARGGAVDAVVAVGRTDGNPRRVEFLMARVVVARQPPTYVHVGVKTGVVRTPAGCGCLGCAGDVAGCIACHGSTVTARR